MTDQRKLFETAVVNRLKESSFLEVEIRVECLARCDDGYQDEVINAGWHYWNAAIAAQPSPETNVVGGEGTRSAGEQRGTDDRLNRSHVGNDHHGLSVLVGHVDRHREGVAGLEQNSGQELLQTLDGFSPNLPNVGAFRADVINTLHTVVEVEKIAGQDQAPSVDRADQSLVEPHGKAHEIANIAQSLMADKPSDPFGQKCTVPAPETKSVLGSIDGPEAFAPSAEPLRKSVCEIGTGERFQASNGCLPPLLDDLNSAFIAEHSGVAFHDGLRTEARAHASPSRRKVGDTAYMEQPSAKETPASPQTKTRESQ